MNNKPILPIIDLGSKIKIIEKNLKSIIGIRCS